jgi:hypothetical protein
LGSGAERKKRGGSANEGLEQVAFTGGAVECLARLRGDTEDRLRTIRKDEDSVIDNARCYEDVLEADFDGGEGMAHLGILLLAGRRSGRPSSEGRPATTLSPISRTWTVVAALEKFEKGRRA